MFPVALRGGPAAARGGTGSVPDPGQVPQHDPRVVAGRLEPVIAVPGGDRVHGDELVRLPGSAGGQPPGPVPAGRAMLAGGGAREPRPARVAGRARGTGRIVAGGRIVAAGGIVAAGRAWCAARGGTCRAGPGFWPGAAVADGVAVLVGDRYAPGGPGVAGGGPDQVAGR